MRPLLIISVLILLTEAATSCKQPDRTGRHERLTGRDRSAAGKLVPIRSAGNEFLEVKAFAKDTLTPQGWSIRYFVRDDSTKHTDLYIQWSKGSLSRIYRAASVLQFRRYFIPTYIGESGSHLFLSHGCATGCTAILTLGKDSLMAAYDYEAVVDFSIPAGKVVYLPPDHHEQGAAFSVNIRSLETSKEVQVSFDHLCMATGSLKTLCIDTVVFSRDRVMIEATLIDKDDYYRQREVTERKTISFQ